MTSTPWHAADLETTDWLEGERVLRRFEDAWCDGSQPSITEHVPSDERVRMAVMFELVVTDMDFRLRSGETVRLETYLEQLPELRDDSRLVMELVVAERDLRATREPHFSLQEYIDRFPEISADLINRLNDSEHSYSTRMRASTLPPTCDRGPDRSPPTIAGYQIVGVLGQGSTGIVYEARQVSPARSVALKMLRSASLEASVADRFRKEAEIAARLQHDNIVQIHFVGNDQGRPFLVFELIRGPTLEATWSDRLPSHRQAAEAVEILSRAVDYAHQRGIMHRDLKPGNVLLDGSGTLRIADFGLAKGVFIDETATVTGEILGTPAYMSPEQACGLSKRVGPASDIYALGAILYRGLTGLPPFRGSSPLDTMAQVRWSAPVPPRRIQNSVPRDLETICLKCLNKDAVSRYGTASELADDLRRFLDGRAILARRTTRLEQLMLWCKRRPAIAVLSLLLQMVCVVGGIVVARQWQTTAESLVLAERNEDERLAGLVTAMLNAAPESASTIFAAVRNERPEIISSIHDREAALHDSTLTGNTVVGSRLNLLLLEDEPQRLPALTASLLQVDAAEFVFMRAALLELQPLIPMEIWREHLASLRATLTDPGSSGNARFHALLALADPQDQPFWEQWSVELADRLVGTNSLQVQLYYESLRPLPPAVIEALCTALADRSRSAGAQLLAATLLSDALAEQPPALLDVFLQCDDKQFSVLFEKLTLHQIVVMPRLRKILSEPIEPTTEYDELDRRVLRHSNAALALFGMGDKVSFWPLLALTERPDLRTSLIHRLHLVTDDTGEILAQIETATDTSVRRAALLAAGEFEHLRSELRTDVLLQHRLVQLYKTDPDPGTHAAVRWLLQTSGCDELFAETDLELIEAGIAADRHWYITPHGHAMTIIHGPVEFTMGSDPETLPLIERGKYDLRRKRRIPRSWAIGMAEVSLPQFKMLQKSKEAHPVLSPDPEGSANAMSWYEAAQYCRWLSEQESVPENQMCYPPMAQIKSGMVMPADYLQRTGYRLATESEWEYSCRAGTTSRFSFGDSARFHDRYAWTMLNALDRTRRPGILKPNDFGLFDGHGNLAEWCQESILHNAESPDSKLIDVEELRPVTNSEPHRTTRGGAYSDYHRSCRTTVCTPVPPMYQGYWMGFRIVRTMD